MSAALRLHEQDSGNAVAFSRGPNDPKVRTDFPFSAIPFRTSAQRRADGEALDVARESARLSRQQIADAWGCDESYVRRVVRGERLLTPERIAQLPAKVRAALSRGVQLSLDFGGDTR